MIQAPRRLLRLSGWLQSTGVIGHWEPKGPGAKEALSGILGRISAHVDNQRHALPALLKPLHHVIRHHEVADRVLGEVLPFAEVGLAQPVAGDEVQRRILGQFGDDVGTDKAGSAGDEDDAAAYGTQAFSIMRAMAAVVE